MSKRFVYFFGENTTEGDPGRKDLLGGKGASLAAMSKAGLPVPPGFTITTECCPLFLEQGGRWPDGLEQQVHEYLGRLEKTTDRNYGKFPNPLLVSVRSGAAVSMPGMMDTLLNCGITPAMAQPGYRGVWSIYSQFVLMFGKTVAEIPVKTFEETQHQLERDAGRVYKTFTEADYEELAQRFRKLYTDKTGRPFPDDPWIALKECIEAVFRSWNSERAQAYRKQNDLRHAVGTAVNIQSMFPSEVSGIAFTVNPNDLAANEMIVESAYGLGEAVVSGDVAPDRFSISRDTLEIKKSVIGRKAHMVRALGDAESRDPDQPSIDPEQLKELAALSMKVEQYFEAPVDLEWGLARGQLSLLQARPIRGLEIVRDIEQCRVDEITRLKTLAGNRRRVWVAHNLGETLPAPTPLTWDVIRGFMSGMGGYGRMYKDFGYRPSARVSKEGLLELICGRIYADPDRVAELFWEHMPMEYDPDAILKNAGELEAPPGRFNPEKADGSFLLSFPGTLLAMLKSSRTMKRLRRNTVERFEKEILPPYLAYLETCRAMDLTRLSTAEVLKELETRRTRVMDEFANQSLQPGFFGGMARARLEQILVQLMGVSEGRKLALELTTGLDNDLTLEQNDCLYQVARGEKTLDQFLEKFGHRAVGEMELAEPRWRADASYLDKIVAGHKQGEGVRPAARHEENAHRRHQAEAALPELLAKFGGSSMREEIQAELNDAQRMLPYRENGKFYLMKGYAEIREALLELSRRWDLGRDLFFLHWEELARFETDRPALEKEINKRKIRWQAARKLEMPEVIDSSALDTLGKPRVYETAQELKGDCISAGVFTGPARIVYHPQEARELGTGFILVCPSTDPGWTALFMHARGLVIERGGVLSHGAIVARDFGIPAVVCPEATRRIPEGAMVRVDGNRGLVTVVENGN